MRRLLSLSLLTTTAMMVVGTTMAQLPAVAADCVYRCASDERVLDFNPYLLLPGRDVKLNLEVGQGLDISVVFWDENYLPVKVMLHRPEVDQLQIELLSGGGFTDRAVHLVNDGRVLIY